MAVIPDRGASALEQFKLLALVRWQAFRNSLRRKQKHAELFFKILFWLASAFAVIMGSFSFFATTYFLFPKRPGMLVPVFWILFVVWQIVPLMLEGQSPALDFREIARYPITFRLFFFLDSAYGLVDPAAMMAIVWGLSAFLGVLLSSSQGPRMALALILFLPLNLFMGRVIFGWVTRITQTRSGRERMMALTLFSIVVLQFLFWMMPVQLDRFPWLPSFVRAVGSSLPPGWAANIVLGEGPVRVRAALALLLTSLCFASLFYRLCRRTFASETAAEGSRRSGAVQVKPGWTFPFLGPQLSAVFEKEVRYILKDPRLFTNLLMVWGFCFVSSFGSGLWRDAFHFDLRNTATSLYPAMTGYSLLVINMVCFNIFGNDPPGFQRWLLSPLPMRDVILAKNLAFSAIVAVDLLVITAMFRFHGPIPLAILARTFLGVAYATLAMVALGNILSVWFPKKIIPGKLSGKNVSEAGVIISLFFMGALGGSWLAVTAVARIKGIDWLPYVAFAVFVLLAAGMYLVSLRRAPSYIRRRLDNMLAELG